MDGRTGMQWRRRAGGLDGECQKGPLSARKPVWPQGGDQGSRRTQKREIFDRGMANLAHETAPANGKHRLLFWGRDRPISETRGLGKSRTAAAFPDYSRSR